MKLRFTAYVDIDTETGRIVLTHEGRGRIALTPPRKGQSVHVVKDDLPIALANTARQLVRKVIDSLILPSDLPAKIPGAQDVERDIKQDLQSIMRREG